MCCVQYRVILQHDILRVYSIWHSTIDTIVSMCCEIVWNEILIEPVTIMFVIDISQGILVLSNSAVFMLNISICVTCTFVSHASDTRYLFVYIRDIIIQSGLTLTSDQLTAIQVTYEAHVWHHQRDASHIWRQWWRHNGDGDRRTLAVTFRYGRTILLYFSIKETQLWFSMTERWWSFVA